MSRQVHFICFGILACAAATVSNGCFSGSGSDGGGLVNAGVLESCMGCHNGSQHNDYAGAGLENPHPFSGGATLKCSECHGGNPSASSVAGAHVPPPPEIGDDENLEDNEHAYFNRLTLTGIDKFQDYDVGGVTYSPIDYLQFINPGDLRVVTQGRSCGQCHMPHVDCVNKSVLATEAGVLSGAMYALGIDNAIAENQGLYQDTAADEAFRAVTDPNFPVDNSILGAIPELREFPLFSKFGETGADDIFDNQDYNVFDLPNDLNADNTVKPGSKLANLYHEQVAFTCGDCHLGSAGANNRYGDFRSSGCTSCHMRYALDGRSTSTDPNINKLEPADPDQIVAPERPHVYRHLITNVAKTLPSGEQVEGIDDYACAGCHQGSNRTVMQFWGIRLDQNQDLRNRVQYPSDPVTFKNTAQDTRLFDPVVNNKTFNGRNPNQYILLEDYDGDGRDDTPADVHYEAGLGCIDCHGSHDLHGGTIGDTDNARILSRMEQAVAITCESCHGGVDGYADSAPCVTYDGEQAECAVDAKGNTLRHVTKEGEGQFFLTSRLNGERHYIKQTKDTVWNNGKIHPLTGETIFNERASYAMGRVDGQEDTGVGPLQSTAGAVGADFSHTDNMSCVACHASWTNSCIGCHLGGEYDDRNNQFFFSNITGDRIVFNQANADFVYQSPVPFQIGVDSHDKISPISPNTETFFQYEDLNNDNSQIFAFSDRNGGGNNPATDGRGAHGALSHNAMMPHSIRGRVEDDKEGVRYCVACHLTQDAIDNFGTEYDDFRNNMANNDFANLDFDLLKSHIGENPGNQLNSPFWVHMVSGLGSGLFLMDENGCPVNPLDDDDNRVGCNDVSPADRFNAATANDDVIYNLDGMVEPTGISNNSSNHALLTDTESALRDGANNRKMAGPLGASIIERLSDPEVGLILDSWLDADSNLGGDATLFINP